MSDSCRRLVTAGGVVLAAAGLAAAFRGPPCSHWRRLALTHGSLGLAALVADPSARRPGGLDRRDVCAAVLIGLTLFAGSSIADTVACALVPALRNKRAALHAASSMISPALLCLLVTSVIAPGEELFWRGLLQDHLERRFGRGGAAVLTSAIYAAAHGGTGDPAIVAAAFGLGGTLSLRRADGASIGCLALTHICYAVPVLLWARQQRFSLPGAEDGGEGGGEGEGRRPDRRERLT
jgi:membrane protease YdiL (CAAX protease family)